MKAFSLKRAAAVARKEIYHVLRDPITMLAALGLPVFMVVMFGVSIEFNVRDIKLSVFDASQSQSSRQLVETFTSGKYFIVKKSDSPLDAIQMLASEESRASLIIPADFEKNVLSGRPSRVQMLLDGSDNATVAPVLGYIGAISLLASKRITGNDFKPSYELRPRFMFNPELNSRWFVIPGLIVIVMAILSTLLTALTVAREYEMGSIEILWSTPITPIEVIIGKLVPYGLLGIIAVIFTYLLARFVFAVPFVGSHFIFAAAAFLFLIAHLAQGIFVSVVTKNQAMAMQMAFLVGMLPAVYLSGFVFPVESMPIGFRYFTALLPARWFMEISRECFLKGSGIESMVPAFLALSLFVVFIVLLASSKLKRDLEP